MGVGAFGVVWVIGAWGSMLKSLDVLFVADFFPYFPPFSLSPTTFLMANKVWMAENLRSEPLNLQESRVKLIEQIVCNLFFREVEHFTIFLDKMAVFQGKNSRETTNTCIFFGEEKKTILERSNSSSSLRLSSEPWDSCGVNFGWQKGGRSLEDFRLVKVFFYQKQFPDFFSEQKPGFDHLEIFLGGGFKPF